MIGRIEARGVNQALHFGLQLLHNHGERTGSRNGPVIVAPGPVITSYAHPRERVLLSPIRDANPFFHLYEALWMLDGRDDVAPLTQYVKRMQDFSDDGNTLHGAYGFRWRHRFNRDQLEWVIKVLQDDPSSRRAVIAMWSPDSDMDMVEVGGKDVPCNTHLYVWIADQKVHMTVCCRSNDIIWGAYGANAVHFSFLLEYFACALGLNTGRMYQLSNNFHAYANVFEKTLPLTSRQFVDPYVGAVQPVETSLPLFDGSRHTFNRELRYFLEGVKSSEPFLNRVAAPIFYAHMQYRLGRDKKAMVGTELEDILDTLHPVKEVAPDWHAACSQWMVRHKEPA